MVRPRFALVAMTLMAVAAGCTDRPATTGPVSSLDVSLAEGPTVHVSSAAELVAAVAASSPGTNVVLAPGDYVLSTPLNVPDGTRLTGSGTMSFDEVSGLPSGFSSENRTVLRAALTLVGDVVVLGDQTRLTGLTIEDAVGRTGGSVVVVHSRRAGDQVRAMMENCEIINPNPASGSLQSVGGRAVVVLTRNRETITSAFAPETGASVTLTMTHCIVRSPRIAGIFVNNFSPLASAHIVFTENVIGGGLQLTGGTSRPDSVYGSEATMESKGNLYRADPGTFPINGLQIYGGAGQPAPGVVEPVTGNTARVHSVNDRIEGFINAIVSRGASRPLASSAALSFNSATLSLEGTKFNSVRGDLILAGAGSLVPGVFADEGNTLAVLARHVTGSGVRNNSYVNAAGPAGTAFGDGNRLEILGSLQAFMQSNSAILPPPPAEFFTAGR